MTNEAWKVCTENSLYEISSEGRVRNIKTQRVLKLEVINTGYLRVQMQENRYFVHRLVAMAFCDGRSQEKNIVNHINCIRDDNRAENLEWVTHSYNIKYAYILGKVSHRKGKFGKDANTSKPVAMIDKDGIVVKRYESGMDAVREGFESASISKCCHGRLKTHRGFSWIFCDGA